LATFKLTNTGSDQSVEVPPGHTLVIGRAVTTDVPIYDPTVSRRHAEIAHSGGGLHVKDLGSSNGTFVNGGRVSDATLSDGDVVTFGKVAFSVVELVLAPAQEPGDFAAAMQPGEGTIIRQVPVDESHSLEQQVARISDEIEPSTAAQRIAHKLVEGTSGDLVPRLARNKLGDQSGTRHVPRSIAQRCVDERLAILTDNAAADERFKGKSIVMQSVRSAMSAPLMGSEGNVLGLIYVDNMTDTNSFGDEDLEFLIAFSGIAAVAIENGQLTDKLAREAVVLSNFQRYFAPNLVEQISNQDGNVELGGTKRPVVIFFTDIRGFTPLSETMGPDDIASLLTEYFTEMVQIVFEYNGTLDKFMGDALMALWGAPLQSDDDADRAMKAAIDMMRVLEELNEKWSAEGRPHVNVGIGINFGEVFAGNIGSEQRMEYTVIGDAVNIASRLCSKAEGGQVIVSEPFYKALKNPPEVEALEPLQLRGKSDTVSVYQVKW
jgi:adenylate cyclase